jgi:hypothetical protein
MTLLPLIDCSKRLTIDPKTLRSWVVQAKMPLSPHPTDARVKCLTGEQVSQLATLYGRVLVPAINPSPLEPSCSQMDTAQAHSDPHREETLAMQPPLCLHDDPDGQNKLSQLEKQVATLQEQLAGLAMILLQERTTPNELRLQRLETFLLSATMPPEWLPSDLPRLTDPLQRKEGSHTQRPLHPAELQMRQVLPPLIEYGAAGTYVIICPLQGELDFHLDSPEWFDWLARLPSFRFVGQQGSFTAYRKGTRAKPSRSWTAQRYFHQHTYRHYLGLTELLTGAHLEQMAARLQSNMH